MKRTKEEERALSALQELSESVRDMKGGYPDFYNEDDFKRRCHDHITGLYSLILAPIALRSKPYEDESTSLDTLRG